MRPDEYSARQLAAKLGFKPGMRVALLDAPPGYLVALDDVATHLEFCELPATGLDVIQVFVTEQVALAATLPTLVAALDQRGALWICWPKRAAKLPTDLDDASVRAAGLATGLVDTKVAAIDATWSGLKFVYRLRDRA